MVEIFVENVFIDDIHDCHVDFLFLYELFEETTRNLTRLLSHFSHVGQLTDGKKLQKIISSSRKLQRVTREPSSEQFKDVCESISQF